MTEHLSGIPSESELSASIERRDVPSIVRELSAEAARRGDEGASESLLVAGAVSDLLGASLGRDLESEYELLSAAWAYFSLLPRRELNVKWLRQLPREDRPFLYVRSLDDVLAAPTLEEAALRLSAILQAVTEPEPRSALFLEAAAWTPGSSALAMTQVALAATGDSAEVSRPLWLRILERIYSARAEIPLRLPADPPPLGWAEMSAAWPEDPDALLDAWIVRPRWLRALERAGSKSASVKAALRRHFSRHLDAAPVEAPSSASMAWAHWIRERREGRVPHVLERLCVGNPTPFLALAGFCAMRSVPPVIEPAIVTQTYRALERT